MKDGSTRERGQNAESIAVDYLAARGCTILDRNYRYSRVGEIDIIAYEGDTLLFVEVRYKKYRAEITALDSITKKKIHRLKRTAQAYLHYKRPDLPGMSCRFDLVTIEEGEIEWNKDIFR